MADERAVKVHRENDEDQGEGHHDGGGSDGGRLAGADGAIVRLGQLEWQELDPAEQHHLGQEEQRADDGGEGPGQLDVAVHALVRGLLHGVEVVHVADGLDVGQDASADHQGEEVHSHQDGGAGAEGNQEAWRILMIGFQLHLHHRHLE